jgi:hypothetical protein
MVQTLGLVMGGAPASLAAGSFPVSAPAKEGFVKIGEN